MSWIWGALLPHPPVIVPEVGRGRELEAAATLKGVETLCMHLAAQPNAMPDVLLVLSPHQPYASDALFVNTAPRLQGSLAPFGAPQVAVDLKTSGKALEALTAHLEAHGIPVAAGPADDTTRDHGALVPLHFIAASFGGKLPPVILGSPIGLSPKNALALGKALRSFDSGYRCALLASGDLSHRLLLDGPNGYHPDGAVFDAAVVHALRAGDPDHLMRLPEQTLHNAGECGLRSVLTLLGLSDGPISVLSYEGPFGVGYCTALWMPGVAIPEGEGLNHNNAHGHGQGADHSQSDAAAKNSANMQKRGAAVHTTDCGHPFPCLARETVRRYLTGNASEQGFPQNDTPGGDAVWDAQKACFVSIKTKTGDLRGCIGTILPVRPHLRQEIMANAIAAATQDPRFPPMTADELDNVDFSVDVLTTPEVITDLSSLDPAIWGVIITKGNRRGLLLPDLPGVNTVAHQIAIAAQKAGITDLEGAQFERFRVERYPEG